MNDVLAFAVEDEFAAIDVQLLLLLLSIIIRTKRKQKKNKTFRFQTSSFTHYQERKKLQGFVLAFALATFESYILKNQFAEI